VSTDDLPSDPPPPADRARGLHVGVAAVLALAAIGFFTGLRGSSQEVGSFLASRPVPTSTVKARSYSDARRGAWGPNSALYPALFAQLSAAPSAPVPPQTPEDRLASLEHRARLRAYDGAPPTIPHQIEQLDAPGCLGCHEQGASIAGKIAPKMSHARHDNCAQCHVVAADPRPFATTPPPLASNAFVGLPAPSGGPRAWTGAPPMPPHGTAMRTDCLSCHGPLGALGLRTTHPERQNCLQCHAPPADRDLRPPQGKPGPAGWEPVP
jgi:cytochrome c-type protein NapB